VQREGRHVPDALGEEVPLRRRQAIQQPGLLQPADGVLRGQAEGAGEHHVEHGAARLDVGAGAQLHLVTLVPH
jgi:hypothetical protein